MSNDVCLWLALPFAIWSLAERFAHICDWEKWDDRRFGAAHGGIWSIARCVPPSTQKGDKGALNRVKIESIMGSALRQ